MFLYDTVRVVSLVCIVLQLVRFPTPARRKGRNRDSGSSKKHKPNLKGDAPSAPSIFKKTKQVGVGASDPVFHPLGSKIEVEKNLFL